MDDNEYAFRCEVRAVELGHRAWVQTDGSIEVVSENTPGVRYRVTFYGGSTGLVWFSCNCPSGKIRHYRAVPCKHATVAGRRLEREKIAVWKDGLWWVHPNLIGDRDG